ncbi:MAG: nuclear transport factor 2 family protein [Deltaproteobacteria bacterium]|nr:nuclear transport factor 2 family protein [Deltaproteobacteria bacterium]MBW2400039.1 nuclear transport factor 2 family protein [Deltaproteobacteria bacterium]MBW2666052.1 nuclear transport factor 2 family protein [Deltaproteobacteria bacterium]
MASEPEEVATEYFARMRAGDVSVVDLFHEDASLVGLGTTRTGKAAIREFYQGVIERAGPSPRSAGPLLADGTRVAAEVFIDLSDEVSVHAVDIFVVEEGRIRSLSYFLCAHSD